VASLLHNCGAEVVMPVLRNLTLVSALVLAAPTAALAQFSAQVQIGRPAARVAYDEGYARGERAGTEDSRRGDRFQFNDESDYRRGDIGYRSSYGTRDRYRDDFRRGFETGYRVGYVRDGRYGGYNGPGRVGVPPGWSNGRAIGRFDLAASNGYNDGYQEGAKDGRDRKPLNPILESRYRSGDHGYDRSYGPKEFYRDNYRDAFRQGYEQGYAAARRY
jgi:hypothetical protein